MKPFGFGRLVYELSCEGRSQVMERQIGSRMKCTRFFAMLRIGLLDSLRA